jgi:hypothetical protein
MEWRTMARQGELSGKMSMEQWSDGAMERRAFPPGQRVTAEI